MTQADSVHSTPPTNASALDRRHFLTIAAVGATALTAAPAVAAMPVFDTAPEIVAKFERLLDEYYTRRSDWGPRLAHAHAETDELFGEIVNQDDAEDRSRVFLEACARLDVDEVHDLMHAVGEEMKPLARAIIALPTTSPEVLRALVAFWEVAPVCASDAEYHFGDAYPFQLLFSAVTEFCGLTQKVAATGYKLPEVPDLFSPCNEDDEEEA